MGDDQLSWETLLGGAAKSAPEPPVPVPVPVPVTRPVAKATLPNEPALSEMDWSSLATTAPRNVAELVLETVPETELVPKTEIAPSLRLSITPLAEQAKAAPVRTTSRLKPKPVADLAADVAPSDEPAAMTVSELNRSIKDILEGKFSFLWVRGEISNFKAHTSGHFYFSLKDSKAQISAVMFRGFNGGLKFRPQDGMEVIVRGKITVYEPRGNYQIFCEMMEPVGAGALQKAFEQLKAKLQAEGLFDPGRKRALPALPRHIAIVTSPTGAAIRDMINVLRRRFKGARITLIPAKVQGDQAPREICAAIEIANRMLDVDVMIVGRGGGSIEDLWAFNEESVARAIAAARVPCISAVGHEIDFTIADFVADLRAPTPSAAAELVVKNAADLQAQLVAIERALIMSKGRRLQALRQRVENIGRRLQDPQRRLQDMSMRCDELEQRLELGIVRAMQGWRMQVALIREKIGTPTSRIEAARQAVSSNDSRLRTGARRQLSRKREAWARQSALLDSLSPLKVVERGYSIITTQDGAVIKDASLLKAGERVRLRFARGHATAEIKQTEA